MSNAFFLLVGGLILEIHRRILHTTTGVTLYGRLLEVEFLATPGVVLRYTVASCRIFRILPKEIAWSIILVHLNASVTAFASQKA